MPLEVILQCEGLVTLVTLEGLAAGVRAYVFLVLADVGEHLITMVAAVNVQAGVGEGVLQESAGAGRFRAALLAYVDFRLR